MLSQEHVPDWCRGLHNIHSVVACLASNQDDMVSYVGMVVAISHVLGVLHVPFYLCQGIDDYLFIAV